MNLVILSLSLSVLSSYAFIIPYSYAAAIASEKLSFAERSLNTVTAVAPFLYIPSALVIYSTNSPLVMNESGANVSGLLTISLEAISLTAAFDQ